MLRALRRRGYNMRHIVIVGAGSLGTEVATRLRNTPWSGLAISSFYDDDAARIGTRIGDIPVRGPVAQLAQDLHAGGIDQVWIALPLKEEERIRALLSGERSETRSARLVGSRRDRRRAAP